MLYSFRCEAIQPCEVISISLLLRVGIKVVDEWQISLGYVRGSNIYVRRLQGFRAWSLRLRAQTEEKHYVKALFSSQEGHFLLHWIRGLYVIRRRACVSLWRDISVGSGRAIPQHTKQRTGLAATVSIGLPADHYWFVCRSRIAFSWAHYSSVQYTPIDVSIDLPMYFIH